MQAQLWEIYLKVLYFFLTWEKNKAKHVLSLWNRIRSPLHFETSAYMIHQEETVIDEICLSGMSGGALMVFTEV